MMTNLRRYVLTFFENLNIEGDEGGNFKSYLTGAAAEFMSGETRQTAFSLYRVFFSLYGADDIPAFIEETEQTKAVCRSRKRDYIVHSADVFLLGLALFDACPELRALFDGDYAGFLKVWGFSALLHDVFMPVKDARDELKLRMSGETGEMISHGKLTAELIAERGAAILKEEELKACVDAVQLHAEGEKAGKLTLSGDPAAYLLTLCDMLEQWSKSPEEAQNPVEEAVFFIYDGKADITYVSRNSTLPEDFAPQLTARINNLLDTAELLPGGLTIRAQAAEFTAAGKTEKTPARPPLDILSAIAREIYMRSRRTATEPEFEMLDDEMKYANFRQALAVFIKLEELGLNAVPQAAEGEAAHRIDEDEVKLLAAKEHAKWMRERARQGWTYGRHFDAEWKQSPYMLPLGALPEDVQQANFAAVRDIPEILSSVGLKAVKAEDEN